MVGKKPSWTPHVFQDSDLMRGIRDLLEIGESLVIVPVALL